MRLGLHNASYKTPGSLPVCHGELTRGGKVLTNRPVLAALSHTSARRGGA